MNGVRVLFLAAFYREISGVVRMCGARRRSRRPCGSFRASYLSHDISIAETGMGTAAAARNAAAVIDAVNPELVISCGYAGALTRELHAGDVLLASAVRFVNADGVEATALPDPAGLRQAMASSFGSHDGTLVTVNTWMKKSDLLHLIPGIRIPAACDMETHALACLCREKHLPFLSMRAISDGAYDEVPFDPACLCAASGQYSVPRAVAFFLAHPRFLPGLPKYRRSSAMATRNLTRAVEHLLRLF